jgi:hypothetical protein
MSNDLDVLRKLVMDLKQTDPYSQMSFEKWSTNKLLAKVLLEFDERLARLERKVEKLRVAD